MCLIAIALDCHPNWPVVIAANRDEFFDRPTRSAHWWDTSIFGGRDLQAGGAWMAVRTDGSFAAVTNVRVASSTDTSAPQGTSRGAIVPTALEGVTPNELRSLIEQSSLCNFIGGSLWPITALHFQTNREQRQETLALTNGKVHTLSNGSLNDPWPKTPALGREIERILDKNDVQSQGHDIHGLEASLFAALGDTQIAADADLPNTGVPLDWERVLSGAFITLEKQAEKPPTGTHFYRDYGTRSSTVIAINQQGLLSFCERTWATDTFDLDKRKRYSEKRTQFQVVR
jgi:uncharacterized protein with NRDE domain